MQLDPHWTRLETQEQFPSVRYAEQPEQGTFNVTAFPAPGNVNGTIPARYRKPLSGLLSERPQWLSDIVNIGKLGEYHVHHNVQPPELVLWFLVNNRGKFESFINFGLTDNG